MGSFVFSFFLVSPVKKSTDNPDSHQQLNHQGQVDFSYKACSEKKARRHRHTVKQTGGQTATCQSEAAMEVVCGFMPHNIFKMILVSPHLHLILSFQNDLCCVGAEELRQGAVQITQQFSIQINFKKTPQSIYKSKYCLSLLGSGQANTNMFVSLAFYFSLCWFSSHLFVWWHHWRRYPPCRKSTQVEIDSAACLLQLLLGPQDGRCYRRCQEERPLWCCHFLPKSATTQEGPITPTHNSTYQHKKRVSNEFTAWRSRAPYIHTHRWYSKLIRAILPSTEYKVHSAVCTLFITCAAHTFSRPLLL